MHTLTLALTLLTLTLTLLPHHTASTPLPLQCRAQVDAPFIELNSTVSGMKALTTGDVDGNGLVDVLSLHRVGATGVVLHHQVGNNVFEETILGTLPNAPGGNTDSQIVLADVAGDSTPDIVFAASLLGYYENFKNAFQPPITIASGPGYECAAVGDISGDGDNDIVACYNPPSSSPPSPPPPPDRIHIFLNNGDGSFASPVELAGSDGADVIVLVDLFGGDGLLDIVYEYGTPFYALALSSPLGGFASPVSVPIPSPATYASDVVVADLTGDNVPDLVTALNLPLAGFVAWYKGDSTSNTFGPPVSLASLSDSRPLQLALVDMDGDGLVDIVSRVQQQESFDIYFNTGPANAFFVTDPTSVAKGGNTFALGLVLGGDSRLDVVIRETNTIRVVPNIPVLAPTFALTAGSTVVGDDETKDVRRVAIADIDLDGDLDVVWATEDGTLAWAANDNGAGLFGTPRTLDLDAGYPLGLISVDLDVDGDIDVAAAFDVGSDSEIFWYENTDGRGTFGPPAVVTLDAPDQVGGLVALDMDADNDLDLAVAATMSVVWWENLNGLGSSWTPHTLTTTSANAGTSVVAFDINNDGRDDLVMAGSSFDRIHAYLSPSYGFPTTVIPSSGNVGSFTAGDVNHDGHVDIVASSFDDDLVTLHTNPGNFPSSSFASTVLYTETVSGSSPSSITLMDADGDGDYDIFFAIDSITVPAVMWLENVDGAGLFVPGSPVVYPSGLRINNLVGADINGDGLGDVLGGFRVATSQPRVAYFVSLATTGFRNARQPDFVPLPSHGLPRSGVSPQSCALPNSFACWWETHLPSASRCVPSSLSFPPRNISCVRDAHAQILFPIQFVGQGPDSVFDCRGDVLFFVGPDTATGLNTGALSLRNMSVVGTGVANVAVDGSPGIRLEGQGTSLDLDHVLFSGCRAESEPQIAVDDGIGGSVLCKSGCSASLRHSRIQHSFASDTGGAMAVTAGSSLSLDHTVIEHSMASGQGGGGLFIDATSSLTMTDSSLAHNTASHGGGGSLLIHALEGERASRTITGSSISHSMARVGGALAFAPSPALATTLGAQTVVDMAVASSPDGMASLEAGSTVARLSLSDVVFDANTASTWGGAMYVCSAGITADGQGTGWTRSVAAVSTSADVFVCPLDPSLPLPGGYTPSKDSRDGIPWLRMDASLVSSGVFEDLKVGSAPASLAWDVAPSQAESAPTAGSFVESSLTATDWLGQPSPFPSLRVRLSMTPGECVTVLPGLSIDALVPSLGAPLPSLEVVFLASAVDNPTCTGGGGGGSGGESIGIEASVIDSTGGLVADVTSASDALSMVLCPPRFGGVIGGDLLRCVACEDGTVAAEVSLDPCLPVTSCQDNAIRVDANNATGGSCACERGFWAPGVSSREDPSLRETDVCLPCPPGGVCAGGSAPPVAAPGFYPATGEEGTAFVACPNSGACVGGGRCAAGYESRGCATCSRGYYRLRGECLRCKDGQSTGVAVLFLVVGALVVFGLLVFNLAEGLRHRFAALMVGLNALQIISSYADLDLPWGPVAEVFFDVASSLNLNVELTSPECAVASGVDVWVMGLLLTLCLPAIAGVLLVASAGVVGALAAGSVGWFADKGGMVLVGGAQRTFVQIMVLLYLALTRAAFSVFGCVKRGGGAGWALAADPARSCYTSTWWGLAAIGGVGVAVYGVGIPAGSLWLLVRARRRLDPLLFVLRYGFFVGRFAPSAFWFEVAIMGRKVVLVMALTFVASDDSKASAGVIVLVGSLMQLLVTRPYIERIHNVLAAVVLAATAIVLHGGTIESRSLRVLCITGGVVVIVLGIVIGNVIDIVRSLRAERQAEEKEFYQDGVFRNTTSLDGGEGGRSDMELSIVENSGQPYGGQQDFEFDHGIDDSLGDYGRSGGSRGDSLVMSSVDTVG